MPLCHHQKYGILTVINLIVPDNLPESWSKVVFQRHLKTELFIFVLNRASENPKEGKMQDKDGLSSLHGESLYFLRN